MNFKVYGLKSPHKEAALSRIDYNFDNLNIPNMAKVIKYFCYCYDSKSPFVTEIEEVSQRKELALEEAGIDDEEQIESLLQLDNEQYILLLTAMMKAQKDRLFRLIVVNEEAFTEYETSVFKRLTAEKDKDLMQALITKDKILESLHQIGERLDVYYRKFFNNEEEVIKKVSFTPEGMKDIV